jgi:hypothetical protein
MKVFAMIVNKITHGYVVQTFDTTTKKFTSQEFIVGDDCIYEDRRGNPIDVVKFPSVGDAYLPYEMVQP